MPRFYLAVSFFAVFAILLVTFHNLGTDSAREPLSHALTRISGYSITRKPLIPRLIWQTWQTRPGDNPPAKPDDNLERLSRTWSGRNPFYTYTRLESNSSLEYIHARYKDRPDIISTFEAVTEPVLRADMIRYLVLSADGGIYSDMDTECIKSIDLWSGEHDISSVGMILGLEYDQRNDQGRLPGTSYRVQFSQWTMASRPNHPVMQHARDRVFQSVASALSEAGGIHLKTQADVFAMTGPMIFTAAVREAISAQMGREVPYKEFSMLPGPKLFGDVLVLPINGFASGVPHSGAADWGNEEQLVGHQFKGDWKVGLTGI
ncbi:nucleotide-diphospho-sugar transferase [Elsinoe ampelina]|uniref:Nucleotide-diphospho-sugar transferase n=1 Tax=Elsinoe ampelina TaxID=302913 RepID=A0A6A6G9X3_9PEZI|nr:nucleotide-diphospho-sugar transferase [Elsinoe ampelina]